MATVRKATQTSSITKKRTVRASVASTRQKTLVQELVDTDFGELDSTKDGLVISYDSVADKFVLVSSDSILTTSAEDANISDSFVTQLESQLNLGDISVTTLDGGSF